ncbi:tetratricopeptide repeat (TPR)-like superfamily protein isoform X4 [Carex rostrata]
MPQQGAQLELNPNMTDSSEQQLQGKRFSPSHSKKRYINKEQTKKDTKQNCLICTKDNCCQTVRARTSEMQSLILQNKPQEVHLIYKILTDEGHIPSLLTYTTLLKALTKGRQFESIPKVMSQVEKYGIKPDSIYYNAVINAFCEVGQINEAMGVYWKMKASGCKQNVSTFNTLIKGYGIAGKPEEAQQVFDMMSSDKDLRPTIRTFNILIKAWCDSKNIDKAWHALEKMQANNFLPDIITYNTIIGGYAKTGDTGKGEQLMLGMQPRLKPDKRTWAIVISGYCREGNMRDAFRCVQEMSDAGSYPNIVVFNTLIKGFLDAHDIAGVNEVLKLMRKFRVKPDIVTYSHQTNAWSEMGMIDRCTEVFEKMVQDGIKPDYQVYSILAKAHARAQDPKKAESILQEMKENGIKPNVVTYTTVISGYCSTTNMDDAIRVYMRMIEEGISPNIKTFHTLIWGYGEAKLPLKAEELLQIMQDHRVIPRKETYDLVASAWKGVGLQDEANRVLESLNGSTRVSVEEKIMDRSEGEGLEGMNGRSSVSKKSTLVKVQNSVSVNSLDMDGRFFGVRLKCSVFCTKRWHTGPLSYGQFIRTSCKIFFAN